jgi:hypothetical protein
MYRGRPHFHFHDPTKASYPLIVVARRKEACGLEMWKATTSTAVDAGSDERNTTTSITGPNVARN